ncbi:GtrA family protein [Microbacterium panaciterrae]
MRILADQRVRFLAVGGVNTILGYVIYAVLAQWVFPGVPLGYLLALVISYAISISVAFVLYRRFVFEVKGNVLIDFVRFVSVYALSILANVVALPILVEGGKLNPLVAQVLVLVVTTVISFVGHKHFSFRRKDRTVPQSAATSDGAGTDPE